MKMKISDLVLLSLIFIASLLISFFILETILLAILYAILNSFLCYLALNKSKSKQKLFHYIDSSYNFVNLMNIQMLSTNSLYEAYKSIEEYLDNDFSNISAEDFLNQLNEIALDYKLNGFKMYINSMSIYDNDGGNYKEIQLIPTSICQKTKIYYHELSNKKMIKLIEISTLFLLWIMVLLFLKISISDLYSLMMDNVLYQFFMLALLSSGSGLYFLSFLNYFNNKIKGL